MKILKRRTSKLKKQSKILRETSKPSPILLRIMAVNVLALAILVGSVLYMGRYQERLVDAELDAMMLQARLCASAISEGAVVVDEDEHNMLSPLLARLMIRRLVEATKTRTRLYDNDLSLLADSRALTDRTLPVDMAELPEKNTGSTFIIDSLLAIFDVIDNLKESQNYPLFDENSAGNGQYTDGEAIAKQAMNGETGRNVIRLKDKGLVLAVAVPVQRYKQTLGTVVLSQPNYKIDAAVREVRINILEIFGITLLITILLSFYLARAIARPLRLLAAAAEKVRRGQMQIVGLAGSAKLLKQESIPDLSDRKDEIGDLSASLRAMTSALAQRLIAIENFAADVAHEIKNPLTSLRSAVETVEKIHDPKLQAKLMAVIRDDVCRMDRLISDISNASRLDAELSRAETEPLIIHRLLTGIVDFYSVSENEAENGSAPQPPVVLTSPVDDSLKVMGLEVRLIQVMQNLIGNALSFSPANGSVRLSVVSDKGFVNIYVEDDGPGIPDNKISTIFDRFYSERPKSEKFGTHSGLGLSISKQIIEAHGGQIWAENRYDQNGNVCGACFIVRLLTVK